MIECKATNITVREDALLPQIEAMIESLTMDDKLLWRVDELAMADDQAEHAKARRMEIIAEMKRLDYLFQKGRKAQRDYDRDMERLESELLLLEPTEAASAEEIAAEIEDLIDTWHAAGDDNASLHEILATLLEAVHIDALNGQIVQWMPRPEFAALFAARGDN